MAEPVGDQLFELPVAEFVAQRDALATRLRSEGRKEEATTVTALRRPTLAAWAVNQVVRAHGEAYEQLVAAGGELQRAQRRALSGVRTDGLREAAVVRRRMVEDLTDLAVDVLQRSGARADSHVERIAATFEAASADGDAAASIGTGRLSAPVTVTTDFSGTPGLHAMPLTGTGDDPDDDEADPVVAERRREAMRALEAARSRADTAATAARTARGQARTAAARADEARQVANAAREAADRAEVEADDLAASAEQAAADATEAATTATTDEAAVAEARATLDDLA